MSRFGIIGFGRFGNILADILSSKNEILIHDPNKISKNFQNVSLLELVKCEILFIAVPIREFEEVVKSLREYKLQNTTIVDVCSVNIYPDEVMKKYLPDNF